MSFEFVIQKNNSSGSFFFNFNFSSFYVVDVDVKKEDVDKKNIFKKRNWSVFDLKKKHGKNVCFLINTIYTVSFSFIAEKTRSN